MTVLNGFKSTRLTALATILAFSLVMGGACDCNDDDPDPDPDTGVDDVAVIDDVSEDVDDDVVEQDVIDDVEDDAVDDVEQDVEQDVVDDAGVDPDAIPEGMARVQIIHNVADPAAELVDIYLEDDLLLDDFAFRTATPFVDVDAGSYEVSIAGPDSDGVGDALITFDSTQFEEGTRYLVVANGVIDDTDFVANPDGESISVALYIFDNARETSSDPDLDELVAFHGTTDAPSVDFFANNATTVIEDLSYGNFSDGYVGLPPGVNVFDVLVNATGDRVASYQTPPLPGGDVYVALASGFLDETQNEDAPFDIVVYPTPVGGDRLDAITLTNAARMQLVHDSIDPATSPADVFINDELALQDVAFRTATPFLTFPSQTSLAFDLTPAGAADTTESVAGADLNLDSGSTQIAVASGVIDPTDYPDNPDGLDIELGLYLIEAAQEISESPDDVDLAPFHSVIDGGEVDLSLEADGTEFLLAEALGYGSFGVYTAVTGDSEAELTVFPPGDPASLLADFDVDTESLTGQAGLVIISGAFDTDEDRPPVAAVIVSPDGSTEVLMHDDE